MIAHIIHEVAKQLECQVQVDHATGKTYLIPRPGKILVLEELEEALRCALAA